MGAPAPSVTWPEMLPAAASEASMPEVVCPAVTGTGTASANEERSVYHSVARGDPPGARKRTA